jgi:hypothetical protein
VSNAGAGVVAPLGAAFEAGVGRIYDTYVREAVHARW